MRYNPEVFKLKNYFNNLFKEFNISNRNYLKLIKIKKLLLNVKKNKNKVLIFGNGGSSAIASHFAIDLIKNTQIRCFNFSDNSLLSCFSNDYGFEKWICKVIETFADKKDLIIFISSSGKSKNMLEGIKLAKKKKIKNIITFSGGAKNNPLSKKGFINFWVNSKVYNHIENTHQIWLLSIVDLIKINILR